MRATIGRRPVVEPVDRRVAAVAVEAVSLPDVLGREDAPREDSETPAAGSPLLAVACVVGHHFGDLESEPEAPEVVSRPPAVAGPCLSAPQ